MREDKSDLVERYLYDVVRRLPEKQKKDIEQELRTLIEDMVMEKEEADGGSGDREKYVKEVLEELGNPAKLARSYRGEHDSLISGVYYDSYCYILKIVLICGGIGIVVSNVVSAIIHVVEAEGLTTSIWNDMLGIGSLPTVLIGIFGWITLGYAILERNHVKLNVNEEVWTIDKIPQVPYKKAVISRGESTVGIVFGVLFLIIFLFVPQLLGAWFSKDGQMISVPLFNLSIWRQIAPLFAISIVAGIIDDFVKLIVGRYCYKVMAVTITTGIIGICLSFVILKMFPIWNANFISEISTVTGRIFNSEFDILTYYNTTAFSNGFLIILFLIFLLDIGTTVYYTVRYGENRN